MSGFILQGEAKGGQLRLTPQPHMPVLVCAAGDFFPSPAKFSPLAQRTGRDSPFGGLIPAERQERLLQLR
jgi:hypothetical protein